MFGLSTAHLLILGLIVLLFGARRLPELGASMGRALRAFKNATDGHFVDKGNLTLHGPREDDCVVQNHNARQEVTKT